MTPGSVTQLLIVLVFVVPGFVYQSVRISLRGRLQFDLELPTRIVRAIVSSGIFALVYLVCFGQTLVDAATGEGFVIESPRVGAVLSLAGGIVVPATVALAPSLVKLQSWPVVKWLQDQLPEVANYDPTPTAWDKIFQAQGGEHVFVRVMTQDGRWIAGLWGPESYATSFPDPQQILLQKAYKVDADGTIGGEVVGSRGILIDCREIQLLQLLAPDAQDADDGTNHG